MAPTICPACKLPLDIPAAMAGQHVACPRCRATFAAPGPEPKPFEPPAPPPMPDYRSPQPAAAAELPSASSSVRREPPATLWDLFDFSFNRYVTPLIVKITWVLTLVLASIWLLLIAVALVMDLMPDSQDSTRMQRSPQFSRRFEPQFNPRSQLSERVDYAWWRGLVRVIILVTQLTGAILFVLWMRVVLESVIVVFNMAASLRSIDRKTRGP
jgi:hypothetical protein